jgi:hypothetical protein
VLEAVTPGHAVGTALEALDDEGVHGWSIGVFE